MLGAQCLNNKLCDQCFFEEPITTKNYQNLLTQSIVLLKGKKWDCWFQQDGMNGHTVKTAAAFLQDFFGECNVGHGLRPP
jgi:hypothetical protein